MDFRDITIEQLAGTIRSGERSAEQVMRSTLERIKRYNPALNAFVALADDESLYRTSTTLAGQRQLEWPVGSMGG
jgi:Asp-tRNA(Asn)/Glu-tRNA(Gln) amidotransferase A subunit family amidase